MRTLVVGILAGALLLAEAGSTLASVDRIDRCSRGPSLLCEAAGKVQHPRQLWMTLTSRPRHDFEVDWATVCLKWSGLRRREGSFTLEAPFRRLLEMGYWRPDRCRVRVSASAGFGINGHNVTMVLRARV